MRRDVAATSPWELSFPSGHTRHVERLVPKRVSGEAARVFRARTVSTIPGDRRNVACSKRFSRRNARRLAISLAPSIGCLRILRATACSCLLCVGWVHRLGADSLPFPSPFSPIRPHFSPSALRCRFHCRHYRCRLRLHHFRRRRRRRRCCRNSSSSSNNSSTGDIVVISPSSSS